MFQIRTQQEEVFSRLAIAKFEGELLEHIKRFAPKHGEILGDDGTMRVIRFGMQRAAGHEFTNKGPIRLYVELIYLLGCDFDTDPQYPWAGQVLGARKVNQMTRADRLYGQTLDFLEKVGGPKRDYAKAALRRALSQRIEDILALPGSLEDRALSLMKQNYPEKCRYVGDPALRALVPRAIASAQENGAGTDKGSILFIALAFTLGHGFAADPQFPWIEGTLRNEQIADPDKRVDRLYSKAMTYLRHVVAYHEE